MDEMKETSPAASPTKIELKDKGKSSMNRRVLDLERNLDYMEGELSRTKDNFVKLTEYVNSVVDRIDKDNKKMRMETNELLQGKA